MSENQETQTVNELIKKSEKTEKSEDAIRFSQAALNCAHALQVLAETKPTE